MPDAADRSAPPAAKYDAFISYSHAVDGKLAPAMQRALHALAKPWYRLRALHVFRDETSLSANPNLWSSIEKALSASRWFIYLASPEASRSEWVQREIAWWLAHHGPSTMLVVLTEGTLRWHDEGGNFDWDATDAFPRAAAESLTSEPLWVDLTWARGVDNLNVRHSRFRAAILSLAAPIHERPPDELDGDDVRQHRRNRLTARAAIAALLVLTAASVIAAYLAVQRSRESVSRELAMYSVQQLETDPELSLRLALHAVDRAGTPQAEEALRRALGASKVVTTLPTPTQASRVTFSPSDETIAVVSGRDVALWKRNVMPILQHAQTVSSAEFSRDGRLLVTGTWDGKVRIWDVATAKLLIEWQAVDVNVTPPNQFSIVAHATLSPDATLLLTEGGAPNDPQSRTARIWDVRTGRKVSELAGHTAAITAVTFAPDGRSAATAGWDKTVRLWDAATGKLLLTLTGHLDAATTVAFSADGTSIISGGLDGSVRVWNSESGNPHAVSGVPMNRGPGQLALDRFAIVSASTMRAVIRGGMGTTVHDVRTGKKVSDLTDFPASCPTAVFSPDDRLVGCAGQDGAAFVWDVETGQRLGVFQGHRGGLNSLSFRPDSRLLFTAGTDNAVRAWAIDEGTGDLTLTGHENSVISASWSPDGRLVATADQAGAARVWDTRTGGQLSVVRLPETGLPGVRLRAVSFSGDGRRLLLSGTGRSGATLWDARSGALLRTFDSGEMVPTTMDEANWAADDGVVTLAASEDVVLLRVRKVIPEIDLSNLGANKDPDLRGDLLRWDAYSGRPLPRISAGRGTNHSGQIGCGYSRAASLVCLATDRDTVSRIWNVRTGSMVSEIDGHMPGAWIAVMSPAGALVALSDQDSVEIWNAHNGQLQARIAARANYTITGLAFDADGGRLVTAGGQLEPVARVWDTRSGNLLVELRGHTHSINKARFSPDGRLLVTVSQDNTGRIWRTEDGRELMVLRGHRDMLFDAVFSPDGRRVLTASGDRSARIYDVSLAKPLDELLPIANQRQIRTLTPAEASLYLH